MARFWDVYEDSKGMTMYSISVTRLNYFLELNGFCTLRMEGRDKPFYIRIDGMKVSRINTSDPTTFLKEWMRNNALPESLQNKVLTYNHLPSEKKSLLKEYVLNFDSHTPISQRFYFRNKWVEVTADAIREHSYRDYDDSGRYVWSDDIIDHNYKAYEPMFEWSRQEDGSISLVIHDASSEFFQYLMNTSRLYWRKEEEEGCTLTEEEKQEEQQCLLNKMFTIGYLLHQYKSPSRAWAAFLQDYKISSSESDCNGRSGKTIFLKALQSIAPSFFIDGRQFSLNKNFPFDGVTADTALIVIDDCEKNFPFAYFFSMITEKIRVEEKGNHQFTIPFEKSPKMLMASNFVLPTQDASTKGRILPVVFSDYYHMQAVSNDYREDRSVHDTFGHNILDMTYPEELWSKDIAFMLRCEQFYLSVIDNNERIMPPLGNIDKRQVRQKLGDSFQNWADEFTSEPTNLDADLLLSDVYAAYCNEVGKSAKAKQVFAKSLKDYCKMSEHIACFNPADVTKKAVDGERWRIRLNSKLESYIYLRSKQADEAMKATGSSNIPPVQGELF